MIKKLASLTIFILKTTHLGFDIKTDSKRALIALSNGIYKLVFLRPDFFKTLVLLLRSNFFILEDNIISVALIFVPTDR